MLLKEEKTAIIQEYATHEGDTGSPEVQIAVLTRRMDIERYRSIIGKLNIRK